MPVDSLKAIREQYWIAIIAKNVADAEMAKLNSLINDEKRRRGDMRPEDELPLFPKEK